MQIVLNKTFNKKLFSNYKLSRNLKFLMRQGILYLECPYKIRLSYVISTFNLHTFKFSKKICGLSLWFYSFPIVIFDILFNLHVYIS